MAETTHRDRLIAIANAEFDRFHELDEADPRLESRIARYCESIGVEPPEDIADFAWSAVFVSWCLKEAGVTESEFKFSSRHAVFVKAAIANADLKKGVFRGHPIDDYAPKPGDIIHWNRGGGAITYKQARTRANYPSHSAIVVEIGTRDGVPCAITVGGNERNSIRRTVVELDSRGLVVQRDRNPFICVIENRKSGVVHELVAKPLSGADRRAAAALAVPICEGSGPGDTAPSMESGINAEARAAKPAVDRTSETPNKNSRRGTAIDHIVLHYTVSDTIGSALNHFKRASSQVSAHYVIGRDGELVQVVPDAERAWHAGHSRMNDRSIGIEHVARAGQQIAPAQSRTSIELIRWLMQEYGIPAENVVPHKCYRDTNCCGDLFADFGGSRDSSCATERTAIQRWLAANGIGADRRGHHEQLHEHRMIAVEATPVSQRMAMAREIVKFEARRDSRGRIRVYPLHEEDGGGRYEVAGINERYHKRECDELVALINSGKHEEAEERAAEFIAGYTDVASTWTSNVGIEFYLRDCIFNRGAGGAAWILQKAVGVTTDMRVGPATLAAARAAEANPRALLDRLRLAREARERLRRDESSQFWAGLVNRWNKAKTKALAFMGDRLELAHASTEDEDNDALELWSVKEAEADPANARTGTVNLQTVLADTADASGEMPVLPPDDAVPFIGGNATGRSFADIGGDGYADDPEKMLSGIRDYRNGVPASGIRPELVIGRDNSLPATFLDVLARRRRAVGRITTSGRDYRGRAGRWYGTGFIIAKNILLTNHHVINSQEVARNGRIDFGYELTEAELAAGADDPAATSARLYTLDPSKLFITNSALDYTFVWIEDGADNAQGSIPIHRASFAVKKDEQAFVIHHPGGRAKRVSLDDADVIKNDTTVVTYSSDTLPGSSGSPVFNRQGRLFALHHASRDEQVSLPDGGTSPVINEGIKLAAIITDIEERARPAHPEQRMAQIILAAVQGSDTQTGFFGQLGRRPQSRSENAGPEAVVDRYLATDGDIDVGFWNIEWLAKRYTDPEKLREAAFLIVDLGLDIWGLSEVSPPAVKALVEELERRFGERYAYALSEPDAPASKQSTAVIWKTKFVDGVREEWPPEIERFWHFDSRDDIGPEAGFEAVDGKIFPRYPGLFRFRTKPIGDAEPVEFYVVPQHLKAMGEGSERRKLASILLARAARLMAEQTGRDLGWIIGGDVNGTLSSEEFEALTGGGFTAMSAADERSGAFSYIKSPKSLIDHIFLSANLTPHAGMDDFFIVAADRTVDNYAGKVSDHRPVLIRLSFAPARESRTATAESSDWARSVIERLLKDAGDGRSTRNRDRQASPVSDGDFRPARASEASGRRVAAAPRPEAARTPPTYFAFASEWRTLANDLGISVPRGRSDDDIAVAVIGFLHARPHGERLLVMFDAGDPRSPEDFPNSAAAHARTLGADLAIYVEGPGGPTGDAWSADEKDRIRRAGRSVGIREGLAWRDFLAEWDRGKWREYTFAQLARYLRDGYSACEIDNLDRVLGDGDSDADGTKLISFLESYNAEHSAGRLPRLILKNISEGRLRRIVQAVEQGRLPRDMFSEFHIAEDGSGTAREQARQSERIAIRTLFSHDTHNYRAHGRYELEAKFGQFAPAFA